MGISSDVTGRNNPYFLGVLTDDSDYVFGSGAGPDFPTGHTNREIRVGDADHLAGADLHSVHRVCSTQIPLPNNQNYTKTHGNKSCDDLLHLEPM